MKAWVAFMELNVEKKMQFIIKEEWLEKIISWS